MNLPTDIQEIFFETIIGEKTVLDFEQWLYADKQLENILSPEDYLDLISYGYKGDRVKYDLVKLLEKHIDKGAYEKWKLLKQLRKALQRDIGVLEILINFYDLYCKGYYFLDNLGLGYGLSFGWDELIPEQQQNLLNSYYPGIELEIYKVIDWLESGKVILTGVIDENNQYEYIDHRTIEEKQPTAYKIDSANLTNPIQDEIQNKVYFKQKPWWKFW